MKRKAYGYRAFDPVSKTTWNL